MNKIMEEQKEEKKNNKKKNKVEQQSSNLNINSDDNNFITIISKSEKRKLINKAIDLLNLSQNSVHNDEINKLITNHINSYKNESYENVKMYNNSKTNLLEFNIFNRKNKIIKDIKIDYWNNIDEITIFLGNNIIDNIERHSIDFLKDNYYKNYTTSKIPTYTNIIGFPNIKDTNIKISIKLKSKNYNNFGISYNLYDVINNLYYNKNNVKLPIKMVNNIKHNFNLTDKNMNEQQIINLKKFKGNLFGIKINSNYKYDGNVKFTIKYLKNNFYYEKICNNKYDEEINIDESKMVHSALSLNNNNNNKICDVNSNIKLTLENNCFIEPKTKYLERYFWETNNEVRINFCVFYRNYLFVNNNQISKNIF